MIDIGFITATVKVYSKKYKTSKGANKETKTKTINLGANAPFNDNDTVYIINQEDYDKILSNRDNNKDIDSFNEQIENFQRIFKKLDEKYQEQFQEIQELKTDNKNLHKDYKESNKENENLHNALHKAQSDIDQKNNIIVAYENMGLWKRIRHYDPKQDVAMLETSTKNDWWKWIWNDNFKNDSMGFFQK